ncbi:MAG: glutathione S-transferase [Deltaproteobacteria bacterium]|nr:MAG: glutathione S-transferase [Deltaproteobacteria bacterium]TMQ11337.1 MAG: glutathione S-transferase [Deltaproteobacteria bacterium]
MLKIWGRLSSINVRKVVFAAQELGLPFERIDAGAAFGIVQTPEYLARNPNGLVPVLEDDQVQLWESNVIVRYLCARHAPDTLYPLALPARFDAERWMDWQQTTLNPAGRVAFMQWIRTPADRRDPDAIARSVAATEALFAVLDHHLSRRPFMAGDRLTMADLPIACEVHRWINLPQPRTPRPHLDRWYAGMQARPASRGVLDVALS